MFAFALSVAAWVASIALGIGGFPWCSAVYCPYVRSSPAGQYGNLAGCLTGPAEFPPNGCSCADLDGNGYVSLRDYAAFQLVPVRVCSGDPTIHQEPGLGFCPAPGSVYRARVLLALDGGRVLMGSLIEVGDLEVDRCIPEYTFPDPCSVAVPFPPRRLTSGEWATVSALVDDIPSEGCQPNCTKPCVGDCCYWFDPCVIWYVAGHDDYCFGEGNADEYRQAIQAVAAYVAELAGGDVP